MKILILSLSLVVACGGDGESADASTHDPVLGSDAGSDSGPASIDDAGPAPDAAVATDAAVQVDAHITPGGDYMEPGDQAVTASTGSFAGDGCTVEVGTFAPAEPRTDVAVVVVPGFALAPGLGSSREALDTLGQHLASWGVATYTLSLCTNGGSIDHAKNGEAIAVFGAQLGVPVIYAGFSAGGLGAMLAAARSERTKAMLALDAVDADDLAGTALDALAAPVHALVGEPSSCNSDENMLAVYEGRAIRVLKINMAQHFIFEGAACEGIKCVACSGGGEREAQAVRALATAFVLGASGALPAALEWWQPGSDELSALISAGLVSELQ